MNGGKFTYENLAKNFDGSFPSLSTIKKLLSTMNQMLESELQIEYLYKYLSQRNLKFIVWMSEDQTKIVEQVVYDRKSNRLLGFVTKLGNNGLPEEKSFLATSAKAIKRHFDNGIRAAYVNVVMAQPLSGNATTAFCIAAYGSSNKFTSIDVQHRWKHLESECLKSGIKTLGFSTDGDPRCLKNMKDSSELGSRSDNERPWLNVSTLLFIIINLTFFVFI